MQEYVIRTNIERFGELLKTCADEARRDTIERLLADEKAKLARLGKSPANPVGSQRRSRYRRDQARE